MFLPNYYFIFILFESATNIIRHHARQDCPPVRRRQVKERQHNKSLLQHIGNYFQRIGGNLPSLSSQVISGVFEPFGHGCPIIKILHIKELFLVALLNLAPPPSSSKGFNFCYVPPPPDEILKVFYMCSQAQ